MPSTSRRFYFWLLVITLGGLAIRLAYAYFSKWHQGIWGDAYYYHFQANGLIHGDGFMRYLPRPNHTVVVEGASADHPPLAPLYYAAWSLVGLSTFHWHMIAGVVLGAGTVFVCGLVGREVVGERTGLIAAVIAAVYGNLWVQDPLVTSETITMFMVAVVVLLAYRFWKQPSMRRALWLGAVCGATALTRAEVVLFLPFVLLPLALRVRAWDLKRRLTTVVAAGAVAGLVMAPWVIRNMTAFKHPLFLSGGAEITMASANCDATYSGPTLGWWSPNCVRDKHGKVYSPKGDASERARFWRKIAFDYIGDHTDRLPVVELARLGRVFELYHPGTPFGSNGGSQKISFDIIEGREPYAARIALVEYFVLMPFALAGAVVLFRRKVTVLPLLALFGVVITAVLVAFGNTRYRAPAEIAIVVLAAVTCDAVIGRLWRARAVPSLELGEPEEVTRAAEPVGARSE